MTVDAVGSVSTAAADSSAGASLYSTTPVRTPKQTLDSETFMSLLVAQLRNQDPSSPMDTNQMISQTTQLAMMEKLTALSTTADENFSLQMRTAAAALVGQNVTYTDATGASVTGIASAVSYAGPVPQVTVGTASVALDAISGVTAPTG
ncbi:MULTISPECIES: flagellar hook assembly protein FlgD [unclassified Cryobacterium]|uniref:flagellar hook assembly protein FlgD n=1 Tax=unclassified Cryobacterium TaxID=2649013 RepID=UPI00106D3C1D|nr:MULTISPECIES: flagellar hook capping FlgD N-terminal domain-containing protein [unclassified Cryobacterium]TFC53491.1 flagellar hook capping protein [Cryobacterium sp. TMB3-1-2]TFC69158.1 flagellar hook capping protein [Cryobacterium sp. TMB3-15]TFC76044.1 flagellar hook capping protein [Cryobacterium sp. TMB3-10]TFC87030.1 flagellar hook capping protein [Cryobacterium sp. TMT4-31]TFD43951.1 flagellar hook capping protein [Cryobacterium sp. TMB3-12]